MLQLKNNNILCISNIFSFGFLLIALKLDVIVVQYAARVCARNVQLMKYIQLDNCESINQNINFLNELLINQTATTALICFLWADS